MTTFTETQRFRQPWVWALLAGCLLYLTYGVVRTPAAWPGLLLVLAVAVLLGVWRLDTRYDAEGLHYRVFPFMAWRTIRWRAVRRVYVRAYSPLTEYGGWGVRGGAESRAYNVAGRWGVQIECTDGRRMLLGTQRPDALRQFLQTLQPTP